MLNIHQLHLLIFTDETLESALKMGIHHSGLNSGVIGGMIMTMQNLKNKSSTVSEIPGTCVNGAQCTQRDDISD